MFGVADETNHAASEMSVVGYLAPVTQSATIASVERAIPAWVKTPCVSGSVVTVFRNPSGMLVESASIRQIKSRSCG